MLIHCHGAADMIRFLKRHSCGAQSVQALKAEWRGVELCLPALF